MSKLYFFVFLVLVSALYVGSVNEVDALKAKGEKTLSPKSFGKATSSIVCGDRLCSESSFDAVLLSKMTTESLSNRYTFELSADYITKSINGKSVTMFGYNSQFPGPLLTTTQGESVQVIFTNNLDVPTTVHWHGLRLPYTSDGVPEVTQKPVLPGETFEYYLTFPDSGIFFYHPHVRTEMQMEMGLYGNILVQPATYKTPLVDFQIPLIIDDIALDEDGILDFDLEKTTYTLMGRFGNTMLVNGDTNTTYEFSQGDITRFYITNTANTRTFDFGIEQHKIKLIGDDASNYEIEEIRDSVIIAPSERRTIDVLFDKPGTFNLIHSTPEKTYHLGEVIVHSSTKKIPSDFYTVSKNLEVIEEIESFSKYFDLEPDLELIFDVKTSTMKEHGSMEDSMSMEEHGSMEDSMSMEEHGSMEDSMSMEEVHGIEWEDEMPMMNSMSNDENTQWILRDTATGKEGFDIDYTAQVGDVKKFRFYNDPNSPHPMQHPIHLHGQRFLVLSEDGVANENLAWKDTVFVPAGKTVDILVEFSNPGKWVMHCHILEHAEAGMITEFTVV